MPSKLRQVLPYTVMLVAAGFLYWAATRIDVDTGGRIGPAVWPKAIIVFMGLLCLYEIAKRLFFVSAPGPQGVVAVLRAAPAGEPEPAAKPETREHPRKLAAGIGLVLAYVLAVPWLGFFITTALFLGAFPWAGGLRRPVLASALGILGSFVLVVVFMRVAYISLPLGEGPFRAVSLALMRLIGVT